MAEQVYNSQFTGEQIDAAIAWLQAHSADQICGGAVSGTTIAVPDNPTYWFAPAGTYTCGSETITIASGNLGIISYDGSQWSSISFYVGAVPLVNDFITGGEESALTAEMGKKLSERIAFTYTKDELVQNTSFSTAGASVGSTLASLDTSRNNNWRCLLLDVKAGDIVYVKTKGGNRVRAYAVVDKNLKVLALSNSGTNVTEETLAIIEDGYVIINCWYDSYDIFGCKRITDMKGDVSVRELLEYEEIGASKLTDNGYYDLFGTVVSDTIVSNENWACIKIPVTKGTRVELYSSAGTSASGRIYALTDDSRTIYNVAEGGMDCLANPAILDVAQDGFLYANIRINKILRFRVIKHLGFNGSESTPSNDIMSLNSETKNILKNISLKRADGISRNVLTIAHISDTHGENNNVVRFNEYCRNFGDIIDQKVNTGDVTGASYDDSFDESLFSDTLLAVGNHDTADSNSPINWTAHQGVDAYNRYIAPLYNGWGVTLPTGAAANGLCYYHKDFASQGVRLLVLDAMAVWNSPYDDAGMTAWLTSKLGEAKTLGYAVVIASHCIPANVTLYDTPFSSKFAIEGIRQYPAAVDAVADYIASGGEFVAWLVGHVHRDYAGKIVVNKNGITTNQIVLCVSTGGAGQSNQDMARVNGEKSQDLFNIYSIDTTTKLIKILRIGANYDLWGRFKQSACISYDTADINTSYGTLYQNEINAGTGTGTKVVTPKIFHDNAYIVEETYSSGSLKANKFYDFGTVSSALTIPTLDATNDLVSNALNFYALRFIAGADNLSITFPTGVIVDDEPTINTGDYVEIMINKYGSNFYASIKVWQAPSQNS